MNRLEVRRGTNFYYVHCLAVGVDGCDCYYFFRIGCRFEKKFVNLHFEI